MSHIDLQNICLNLPKRSYYDATIKSYLAWKIKNNPKFQTRSLPILQEINLTIKSGMRVGIIGRNGSGKTSLLKVIAGILPPSKGKVAIQGVMNSIINAHAGFDSNLTGYENIIQKKTMLGDSKADIKSNLKKIIQFSELGDFIREPLSCHSSGMIIRLALSIALNRKSDILLLDECFGVLDAYFIEKIRTRINTCLDEVDIFVLVSHSQEMMKRFCDYVVWIEQGRIVDFGVTEKILAFYNNQSVK